MSVDYECAGKKVEELVSILKPMCDSYRLLVGAAEEFNHITLAHKDDVVNAIDRADDLGDVIDHIIHTLDCITKDWLYQLKKYPCENVPPPLPPDGGDVIIEPGGIIGIGT